MQYKKKKKKKHNLVVIKAQIQLCLADRCPAHAGGLRRIQPSPNIISISHVRNI